MNSALAKACELELKFLETLTQEQRDMYHEMENLWFQGEADYREDMGHSRGN